MDTIGGWSHACEQHHADLTVIADAAEGITQFSNGLRPEGIALGRSIDGDPGDPLGGSIHKDVVISPPGLPLRCGITGENLPRRDHQLQSGGPAF